MSMSAKLMMLLGFDGSQFSSGMDKAEKKASGFDAKVKGVGLSIKKIEKALGFGLALGVLKLFSENMKEVQEMGDKGIKILAPGQLDELQKVNAVLDEVQNTIKSKMAVAGTYLFGGLSAFAGRLGAMSGGASWKEAGDISAKQLSEQKTNKRLEEEERIRKKLAEEKKKSAFEDLDLESKYKSKTLEIRQLEGQLEGLAKIKKNDELEGLEVQEKIAEAKSEQIKLEKELMDAGEKRSEEMLKKDEEAKKDQEKYEDFLNEVAVDQMVKEDERAKEKKKKLEELTKKKVEVEQAASQKIADLDEKKLSAFKIDPSSSAKRGMWMGEKDRSGVAEISKRRVREQEGQKIQTQMGRDIAKIREEIVGLSA